jgi:allantoinase
MRLSPQTSEQMHRRIMDQFETLYAESRERPKIMAIAMHCYLSGAPHRIAYVGRAFEEVLSKPGVAAWDGVRILDWYKKQVV